MTDRQDFIQTARRQFQRCCIPTAVAIAASVTISSLGAPVIPLALAAAGGYAYWRGYRITINKQPARPVRATPRKRNPKKGTS